MPQTQFITGTVSIPDDTAAVRFARQPLLVSWISMLVKAGSSSAIVVGTSAVVGAASGRRGLVVPEAGTDGSSVVAPLTLYGPLDISDLYASIPAAATNHVLEWWAMLLSATSTSMLTVFDSTDQAVSVQASRNRASARALF